MKIFNLPEDIDLAPGQKSSDIIFHRYTALVGTFNGRSMLTKNAISLVINGEKTIHFAEKKVNVNADEFHFLSRGNCLISMQLSEATIFKSFLIFFSDKVLADFYLKYDKLIAQVKPKSKLTSEPYLAFKKDDFVWNFIGSLNLLFQNTAAISTEMKLLKFEELMLHLLQNYPEKLLSFQWNKKSEFDDLLIRKAVETNVVNKISVEELAFLCNVSISTFKRRFEKIYGTSPSKWILQRRMEIARDLLTRHHEKPSEVFHKVGYENHSSFTESFKQAFGLTPKEFQLRQLNL
jgi:AraC-like DNA-binding protein